MFERLLRTLPATGEVLFAGALPPPEPQFLELMLVGLRVTRVAACDDAFWDLHVEHPEWGRAGSAPTGTTLRGSQSFGNSTNVLYTMVRLAIAVGRKPSRAHLFGIAVPTTA